MSESRRASEAWTFDVALSFAGDDRPAAQAIAEELRKLNITVFYDEWFKTKLWGAKLHNRLPEIYLKARFCVPLISQRYLSGSYPRYELDVMLEREMRDRQDTLLPVRIDDTEIPGLSRDVVWLSYPLEGASKIAAAVAQRLDRQASGAHDDVAEPSARKFEPGVALPSHIHSPASSDMYILMPGLLSLLTTQQQTADTRARIANELVIYLNWKQQANLGTPYGAWLYEKKLMLSTYPRSMRRSGRWNSRSVKMLTSLDSLANGMRVMNGTGSWIIPNGSRRL